MKCINEPTVSTIKPLNIAAHVLVLHCDVVYWCYEYGHFLCLSRNSAEQTGNEDVIQFGHVF